MTKIDSKGFISSPVLQWHLEDIASEAEWLGITLSDDEIRSVAVAMFEDNEELANRIDNILREEAEETIKHLKSK